MNIRFYTYSLLKGRCPCDPNPFFVLTQKKESKKVKAVFASLEKLSLVG